MWLHHGASAPQDRRTFLDTDWLSYNPERFKWNKLHRPVSRDIIWTGGCVRLLLIYILKHRKQIPHNRLQVNAAMWCIGLFLFKAWWRKWLNWSVTIFSRSQVYVIIWCKPTRLPPFCFSLCWIKLFSSGWFPQFRLILTSWQYFPHQQVTEWARVCTIVSSFFNTGLFLALYDQHDPFFQFRNDIIELIHKMIMWSYCIM